MKTIITVFFLTFVNTVFGQYSLSGKILNDKNKRPVEYAVVSITEKELQTLAGEKGEFFFKNISAGETIISVSCLGFVKKTFTVKVVENMSDLVFYLSESNLALDEVVITAKSKTEEPTTSYLIDNAGLEHIQVIELADVMSLLPGGQTNRSLHQASSTKQRIALRGAVSGENGNPTFGTAIEVDGVRLSGNALFDDVKGVDTRNIASSNIESVEVITGVASVEYGDMTNGVVKINTRKGKSPLRLEMTTKPNTKQISLSKGFSPGRNAGVMNVSLERSKSISALESPFTSYDRNGLSLFYENRFNAANQPLIFSSGITGNLGGYNSKSDPDAFKNTYSKEYDNTFRAQAKLVYMPDKLWITSVEISGDMNYSNNLREEKTNKSNSTSTVAIHGREEGYFVANNFDENPDAAIVLIPAGYWYQTSYLDSKPLYAASHFKAKLARKIGRVNNNLMLGADFSYSGNRGKGEYYSDFRYAPTWREYRYDRAPVIRNLAVYLEEKATIGLPQSSLQLVAGIRSDQTFVAGSEYGAVNGFSPRFNVRYVFWQKDSFLERLTVKAGWGKSVKLPSIEILAPRPSYTDKLTFAPGTMSDGTTFYAYHLQPFTPEYNPELRWQSSRQADFGIEAKLKGIYLSLSLFDSRIHDAFRRKTDYTPFSYKFTGQEDLETCPIPSVNRRYSVDRNTGIVSVSDKTGQFQDVELNYKTRNTFKSFSTYVNAASPSLRRGVEWIVDFGKIRAIGTSIRIDGNFYRYRSVDETVERYSPIAQTMADRNPYKYIGVYAGGHNSSNGSETRRLNTNLTFITHIPAVRLIVSLRIEASLYNYSQRLSEYEGKTRGFALDKRESYFPAVGNAEDIYNTGRYVALYPLYYVSFDDMNTLIPFAEKFAWAKDNDRPLYNELVSLVASSNTDYFFNTARLSAYYSANISITKELGDIASISFNALNFTNNMQLVKSSDTGLESTIYDAGRIPRFYYGLSLKLKIQ